MALGAWGAVQATCAGLGVGLAGIVRDVLLGTGAFSGLQAHAPYNVVFMIEIAFLAMAIFLAIPLAARRANIKGAHVAAAPQPNSVEVP